MLAAIRAYVARNQVSGVKLLLLGRAVWAEVQCESKSASVQSCKAKVCLTSQLNLHPACYAPLSVQRGVVQQVTRREMRNEGGAWEKAVILRLRFVEPWRTMRLISDCPLSCAQ